MYESIDRDEEEEYDICDTVDKICTTYFSFKREKEISENIHERIIRVFMGVQILILWKL
jgi:hypothetical protein